MTRRANRLLLTVMKVGLSVVVLATAGCSGSSASRDALAVDGQGAGWWTAAFHPVWQPQEAPHWHIDALLADQLLAPLLEEFQADIRLWRFHRRAAPDAAGHRFSFMFYASPRTARVLRERLQKSSLLGSLLETGTLTRWTLRTARSSARPEVGDTSDRHWSASMQAEWPHFIMGVSRTWLGLIQAEVAGRANPSDYSVAELLILYGEADLAVRGIWQQEGGHALLHHLNAVFGYEPVAIGEHLLRF